MIVAGGSYVERCAYPFWNRLFGSGLRAALALQGRSSKIELHTYAPPSYEDDIKATVDGCGIDLSIVSSKNEMVFQWLHPFELLSWPDPPSPKEKLPPLRAEGDAVLRFGMIEGSAKVDAIRAVYDPQNEADSFLNNHSRSRELVVIISERELLWQMNEKRPRTSAVVNENVSAFFHTYKSRFDVFALLLKDGLGGIKVYLGEEPTVIPTYAAESFFKIGVGDVLAASFAHSWAVNGDDIVGAADSAAKAVAWFVEGARLPIPPTSMLPIQRCAPPPRRVRILGSDTIEIGQLLVRTDDWIRSQGVEVDFDVFYLSKSERKVPTLVLVADVADIASMNVLAMCAEEASRLVVLCSTLSRSLAVREFPDAIITDDYATALFHLLRENEA